MIQKEKQEKALKSIHNSIIHIKMMILKEKTPKEIFDYVDEIEYLPSLLLSKKDNTIIFEQHLENISKNFDVPFLWKYYNEEN